MESDKQTHPLLTPLNNSQQDQTNTTVVFTAKSDDIPPITGAGTFAREFLHESKKLWYLAGPAIFTAISQYSLGAVTQVFAGQIGTLQLAAVSIENSVIAGFCLGITVTPNLIRNFVILYINFIILASFLLFVILFIMFPFDDNLFKVEINFF